ncbi:uncharacterized protein LOC119721251 [Patiria miniata]|uniref:Fork-head domain-containing protein n=1 Tax=Patiria miniata TaxID=46514 RepID=A0A913Z8I4_PATMI|nr:uncharacterized protein LOC119721251 [Patiria miniata]
MISCNENLRENERLKILDSDWLPGPRGSLNNHWEFCEQPTTEFVNADVLFSSSFCSLNGFVFGSHDMSDNAMSDRVELSEALRSILDDPYSESEPEDQKENLVKTEDGSAGSLRNRIKCCVTPISKALGSIQRTGHSVRPVLAASTDRSNHGMIHTKRRKSGFDEEQSPPKKRRHANHVIILRQPRSKGKPPQKSSPKPSPNRRAQPMPSESKHPRGNGVKLSRSSKEFTVELDSGIGGTAALTHSRKFARGLSTCKTTPPPKSVRFDTPSSAEKYLDAAIESQIKTEVSEEELESGLPVLDGLDLTASPFCHFKDAGQQQLYSELEAYESGSLEGNQWPANQEEALQLAASQHMLQCAGNVCYSNTGRPFLPGETPFGRWVTRGGSADDSLTNITWLKRMSAPDLDPNSLQTSQMIDPRFERPTYSYSTLIQFAISSSKSGKMTLREIYTWIEETFPYFKTAKAGWRNSIRHNLSLHKIFVREPPLSHGQPAFWTLRPGTVVHLPEHRMFVADPEGGGTLLEEVAPPPVAPILPPAMADQQQGGVPYFMGGAMPPVVMVPGLPASMASANNSRDCKGPGPKTKKPPLILPRGSQPYALIPVPMLLPPNQNGGQTPGDGTQGVPHILSPVIMGGVRRFAAAQRVVGGRRVVPIAPKMNPDDGAAAINLGWGDGNSASSCNLSSGSDSAVDLSGQGWTSSLMSTSGSSDSSGNPTTLRRDLPYKKQGHGRKSLPKIRKELDETEAEDSFTAFFEQELASPPKPQPNKGMPVVSTPCKEGDLQTFLSPLRGFTPFKNQSLDPDSGIFHDLHGDLSFTPLRTGLTPNYKGSHQNAARGQRSRVGSLGELGLPGLTPEKEGASTSGGIHNQSLGQIFGDLVGLDMVGDGLDAGNISWSMFSPNKQHAK